MKRPETATLVATAATAFLIGNAWHDFLATKKLTSEEPVIDPIENINGIESGSSFSFPLKGLAMRLEAYKVEGRTAGKADICFTPACVPGESRGTGEGIAEPVRPVAGIAPPEELQP